MWKDTRVLGNRSERVQFSLRATLSLEFLTWYDYQHLFEVHCIWIPMKDYLDWLTNPWVWMTTNDELTDTHVWSRSVSSILKIVFRTLSLPRRIHSRCLVTNALPLKSTFRWMSRKINFQEKLHLECVKETDGLQCTSRDVVHILFRRTRQSIYDIHFIKLSRDHANYSIMTFPTHSHVYMCPDSHAHDLSWNVGIDSVWQQRNRPHG